MYRDVRAQLRAERAKNEQLKAENKKLRQDMEYLAMMTDVDMDDEEESDHE